MKVLMLNGSPRANGNTAIALEEMRKVFAEEGVEVELVQVAKAHTNDTGGQAAGVCGKRAYCVHTG